MVKLSIYSIGYFLAALGSLFLLFLYQKTNKKNQSKNYFLIYLFVFIINFNYFLLSISKTRNLALWSNRLVYLGTIFLINELLVIIKDFCNITPNKIDNYVRAVLSFFQFILVFSGGTSISYYYTNVDIKILNNTTYLVKEYGSLHFLYSLFIALYFLIMIFTVCYSLIKKKINKNVNPTIIIFLILENIIIWIFERFSNGPFELLSISYLITEIIVLILIKNNQEDSIETSHKKSIDEIIAAWQEEYHLTNRELQILKLLLDNIPRSDIASTLFITEHTVKKHTTHIYEKINVKSRNELLYKMNEEISN